MTLTDLSPPPVLAVSLDAAKVFLRVDHDDEDALITDLIDAASRQIEDRCGVSLITRPQRLTKTANAAGVYLTRYPICLLYTSPSPRDRQKSRMPSSA